MHFWALLHTVLLSSGLAMSSVLSEVVLMLTPQLSTFSGPTEQVLVFITDCYVNQSPLLPPWSLKT